jgi:hypothetical protein
MKTTLVSAGLIPLVLLGCKLLESSPAQSARLALAVNEQKWNGQAIHNYSFDYNFSGVWFAGSTHIVVRADTVNQAVDLKTGAALPNANKPTVDSVFSRIRTLLSNPDPDATVDYNFGAGYPMRVESLMRVPDAGSIVTLTNFQRLQ